MNTEISRRAFVASSAVVMCNPSPAVSGPDEPFPSIKSLFGEWIAERQRTNAGAVDTVWSDDELTRECQRYHELTDMIERTPATDMISLAIKFLVEVHFGDFEPSREFILEAARLAGLTGDQIERYAS